MGFGECATTKSQAIAALIEDVREDNNAFDLDMDVDGLKLQLLVLDMDLSVISLVLLIEHVVQILHVIIKFLTEIGNFSIYDIES